MCSMKLFSPQVARYLYKSTKELCMNTVVMSGLVLLAAAWICKINYKTNMSDCSSFICCLS